MYELPKHWPEIQSITGISISLKNLQRLRADSQQLSCLMKFSRKKSENKVFSVM